MHAISVLFAVIPRNLRAGAVGSPRPGGGSAGSRNARILCHMPHIVTTYIRPTPRRAAHLHIDATPSRPLCPSPELFTVVGALCVV